MPLVAPVSGVVKEVCVSAGQEVEAEATIAVIEQKENVPFSIGPGEAVEAQFEASLIHDY